MYRRLLILTAESPVHAGGANAEGALDLPIQRETSTGLPVIWGQSLKGALRDAARDQPWETAVFGDRPPTPTAPTATAPGDSAAGDGTNNTEREGTRPQDEGGELSPGGVAFGDAQLVAFPAATLESGFAWTTSRLLLHRLQRKTLLLEQNLAEVMAPLHGVAGVLGPPRWKGNQVIGPYTGGVHGNDALAGLGAFLGMLAYPTDAVFDYSRAKMRSDLLVLPDADFTDLTRLGAELLVRIQLNTATKTVAHGPFYAEHLPAETILAALLTATDDTLLTHLTHFFDGHTLQLGGDETIGKGVLWCRVHDTASLHTALTDDAQPDAQSEGKEAADARA
ncbi:type III-B CRISPR module RAMP protein Cmr4 [Nocardia sp. NPDC003482]